MEQIFAPWRIDWVERDSEKQPIDGCPFCVLSERDADRESRIVARSEHSFALLNNYPYNPGHLMIPYRHVGDYTDLTETELLDHARLKQVAIDALHDGLDPDGLNMGMNSGEGAGGSIDDHLHTHLVPRWEGDTNFMPVIGETNVIVEAVDDTYERLHAGFAAQSGAIVDDAEGDDSDTTEQAVEFAFDLAVDDTA